MAAESGDGSSFPTSLSPSRANDFQTCPLLFRLRSIDRLPEDPSAAAIRGTLVHEALERLFLLSPRERTGQAATGLLHEALGRLEEGDPGAYRCLEQDVESGPTDLASAIIAPLLPLMDTYFAIEDPQRITPHAREMAIEAELAPGFNGRGFIDRVEISPEGLVRIVDYKTGRSPGQRFESKAMFQMRFYALLWWRTTGTIPAMLQLMYLGDGQTLRLTPTEEQLVATESTILAIRGAIQQAVHEGFVPTPSRLCDWCSFKPWCPAFDGTPPPLPDVGSLGDQSGGFVTPR